MIIFFWIWWHVFIQHTCFFVQKRGVIVETPLVVFPTSYIENEVCWSPQTLDPNQGLSSSQSLERTQRPRVAMQRMQLQGGSTSWFLEGNPGNRSKKLVSFPTKNALGKVGPEAYGNFSFPSPLVSTRYFWIRCRIQKPQELSAKKLVFLGLPGSYQSISAWWCLHSAGWLRPREGCPV